jgi:cation/acetate symporter
MRSGLATSSLFVTIAIYACIGLICRTSDLNEYYVAGRRVPAMFNGMAIAADWMSAASFIGLAGIIFVSGYEGLAYVMGWTGGYAWWPSCWRHTCASTAATIPISWRRVRQRQAGRQHAVRAIAVLAASLCSFVLVAQIQESADRHALHRRGICRWRVLRSGRHSLFVPGWNARRDVDAGGAVHHAHRRVSADGVADRVEAPPRSAAAGQLWQVAESDRPDGKAIERDPAEIQVREIFQQQAIALQDRIARLPESFLEERNALDARLLELRARNAPLREIKSVERERLAFPVDAADALQQWTQMREDALARSRFQRPRRSHTLRLRSRSARRNGSTSCCWCSA